MRRFLCFFATYLMLALPAHALKLNFTIGSGSASATSGTVTSIATTGPLAGGTITTSGTLSCPTCVITDGNNTLTGRLDASGSTSTAPIKSGTSLPGTCVAGKDLFFKTDATAGQNLYFCTATNTWTQQLNNAGGGITSATNHGIVIATAATTATSLGVATNGQIPIGSTGVDPVLGAITGTANQITVTLGAGTIGLSFPTNMTLPGNTTGTFIGNVTGLASTATALAANGSNCAAGQVVTLGVDAAGAAEGCSATPTLGAVGTLGTLALSGNTSGVVTIAPAAAAGTWTMTLPTTGGTNGFLLQTNGSGVTSWVAAPGGGNVSNTGTPTSGQLALWTSATVVQGVTALPAANFPALTGDVTTSAASLTTTIAAGSVTLAKQANIATASFLGRNTAATGVIEVLSIATAKTMLGLTGTNSGDQTITLGGDVTGSGTGSITAVLANIPTATPMAGSLLATAITAPSTPGAGKGSIYIDSTTKTLCIKNDAGTVTCTGGSGTVTSIATTTPITGGTITTTGTIACATCVTSAAALTNNQLVFGGGAQATAVGDLTGDVTTSGGKATTIASAAVTLAKMANMATASLLGRSTAATGVPEVLSAATASTLLGVTGAKLGYVQLPIAAVHLPATNPARIDASENNTRLLFDGTTAQCAWWQLRMPPDYGSALHFKWQYSMTSDANNTHSVTIDVSVMAFTSGDAADANIDSYDTANTCTDAAIPATLGYMEELDCTLTNTDSLAAADLVRLKVCRNMTDTATGDMEGLAAMLEFTKSP